MPLDLGVRIRQARLQAGMSQADLAKRLKVHRSAVAKWESNRKVNPNTRHLTSIAKVTDVRLEWLASSRGQMKTGPDEISTSLTLNTLARDSMEITLLEWFRKIPARARMSFIEHLRAAYPKQKK